MTISGVMPLRNAVKLGYPFELAIRSLRPLCDEVVILVDPTSEDNTLARVRALAPDRIIESAWDMTNHQGHTNCEISVQTAKVCAATSCDWVLSLQADEVLHEDEVCILKREAQEADTAGVSGLELLRLYFYGGLDTLRDDWTIWLLRMFRRNHWKPDVDGAMRFDPCNPSEERKRSVARIYHYSRIGDPRLVAERVRNLDLFFHEEGGVRSGDLPAYDFSTLRRLDTYVIDASTEVAENAHLTTFPIEQHPRTVREYFA